MENEIASDILSLIQNLDKGDANDFVDLYLRALINANEDMAEGKEVDIKIVRKFVSSIDQRIIIYKEGEI